MSPAKGGRGAAAPARIFDNDDATEWLESFHTDGARAVEEALNAVAELDPGDFVDGPEAAYALAAAELVAAARDGDTSRLPADLTEALEEHRDAINDGGYAKIGHRAVARILRRSELKDQWDDESDGEEIVDEVRELQERLKG